MRRGERVGWLKIKSACTKFLTNQTAQESDGFKKLKENENPDTDLDMDWIVIVCFNNRNLYNYRLWGPIIGPSALFGPFFSGFPQLFG